MCVPSKCQRCLGKTSGYLAFFSWVTASTNLVHREILQAANLRYITCSLLDRYLLVKFWLSNIFLQIWIPSNSSSPSHTKIWSNAGLMSFLNSFKDRLPFPSWMMTMRNSCEVVAVWTTLRLYPQGIFTTLRAWYRNKTFTTPWQCGNRDVLHICWDLQTKSRPKTFPPKK